MTNTASFFRDADGRSLERLFSRPRGQQFLLVVTTKTKRLSKLIGVDAGVSTYLLSIPFSTCSRALSLSLHIRFDL